MIRYSLYCMIGNHELMALECMEFSVYEEVSVGNKDYLLVHAGRAVIYYHCS